MADRQPGSIGSERRGLEWTMALGCRRVFRVTLVTVIERSGDAAVRCECGRIAHDVVIRVARAGAMTAFASDAFFDERVFGLGKSGSADRDMTREARCKRVAV